ncbi:uncharacterized protein LOC142220098 [Haematobia irritans]|uniref:uncharacterized protein LOC142220098 n=1 Tax=Haematobia irritans TaxID=7368 RepID=UPI003F5008E9
MATSTCLRVRLEKQTVKSSTENLSDGQTLTTFTFFSLKSAQAYYSFVVNTRHMKMPRGSELSNEEGGTIAVMNLGCKNILDKWTRRYDYHFLVLEIRGFFSYVKVTLYDYQIT